MNEQFSTVNLTKGSNKVYAGTSADWSSIRSNSFLKVQDISTLYTILDTEKHFFIKKFENKGNSIISIPEDVSAFLNTGDEIKISFKEHLVDEFFLKQGGSGYSTGDLLEIENENSVKDSFEGKSFVATFKVQEIGSKGEIRKVSLENRGRYLLQFAEKEVSRMKGGYGSGAEIEINFIESGNIKIITKTVLDVELQGSSSEVSLESPFEQSVQGGKLSFEKWSLETKHPHKGNSAFNREATITRDFTPHCKMPFIPGTNDVTESHYNKTISILDRKIAELEERLNNL